MGTDSNCDPLVPSPELIRKIRDLPAERIAELEDFVDFLRLRAVDRELTRAAARMTEDALRRVWDNPDDAEYDHL
ncbi:MAG: toxin-antitoxin system, antitoxin component, Xre family protein [Deltaproteobacteria bacterium]|nr:toxin-antitoxin system, antitoxin component, Xre family protein [Deltaproteobacteria bacterium]